MIGQLISRFTSAATHIPESFLEHLRGRVGIALVIAVIVYLFAVFFTNKVANFIRPVIITLLAVGAIAGFILNRDIICSASIIGLLFLFVVRLLRNGFVSLTENRRNSRIEAKALAKAKKRRGTWQNRKGYSGDSKPLYHPEDRYDDEDGHLDQVLANAYEMEEEAQSEAELQSTADVNEAVDQNTRNQVMRYSDMLSELRNAGLLTDEEFKEKQIKLMERMG